MNNKYEAVLIFSVLNKDEAAIAAMVEKFKALIEAQEKRSESVANETEA